LVVPRANDDVGVKMPGVEMIDGHPIAAVRTGEKISG
jgi:hypothetical protein